MPYVEYDEVEAICPDCGRTFRSEEALSAHREESHAGVEEAPRAAAAAGSTCPLCGRSFATSAALRTHTATAHRGSPSNRGR